MPIELPDPKDPYLYILMRSDLDSLNPGKMVAQGAHAANQFTFEMERIEDRVNTDKDNPQLAPSTLPGERSQYNLFTQWQSSTKQGFGVTICLDVTGRELPLVVAFAKRAGLSAGITHDPSYPLSDGQVTHLLPLDTCGYVFGDKTELRVLLSQFNLFK